MGSIGFDLGRHARQGLLRFHSVRPTLYGLESHLVTLHKLVTEFRPEAVVMDPITNLSAVGDDAEIKGMLTRVIDFLKGQGITAVFTSLTSGSNVLEQSEVGVSSLMDTWLLLSMVQSASERNRVLYLLKSRGMAHSNQMREFVLSDKGIDLVDVYTGPGAVYTGAARLSQEAHDKAETLVQQQADERRQRELEQERRNLQAQVAALQTRLTNIAAEAAFRRHARKAARRRRPAVRGATGPRTESGLKRSNHAQVPKQKRTGPTAGNCGSMSPARPPSPSPPWQTSRSSARTHLAGRYEIEVIDLLKNPKLAAGDQILAIPTLVRRLPTPVKKIIGDLSNEQRVLVGLDLRREPEEWPPPATLPSGEGQPLCLPNTPPNER